ATILVARLLDAKRSRKTRRDRSSRLIDRRVAIETEIDAMEPPEHAERDLRARDIHEENLPAERAQRTFLAKESADAKLEPSVVDRHPERIADLEIALPREALGNEDGVGLDEEIENLAARGLVVPATLVAADLGAG